MMYSVTDNPTMPTIAGLQRKKTRWKNFAHLMSLCLIPNVITVFKRVLYGVLLCSFGFLRRTATTTTKIKNLKKRCRKVRNEREQRFVYIRRPWYMSSVLHTISQNICCRIALLFAHYDKTSFSLLFFSQFPNISILFFHSLRDQSQGQHLFLQFHFTNQISCFSFGLCISIEAG